MTPKVTKVKLSEIRFDEAVYPRQKHDPRLVQRYSETLDAIEAKHNFISVSEDMRIVDGKHRYLAYQTAFPDDADHSVSVYVYPVSDNDAVLDLAAQLNATSGWQLTEDDKRRLAVKMYNRATRKTQEEIAETLSVRVSTVSKWLASILEEEKKEREGKMLSMWLACHSLSEIATAIELSHESVRQFVQKIQEDFLGKESGIFRNFDDEETDSPRRIYDVWTFPKATNEVRHFGNIPPEIIDNLLYLYTKPFDVVFDPFGGGGSTIDRCVERKRRHYVSDLTPIKARDDIRQHDITTGLPKDLPVPDLVFLDPPFWKQAEGKYSDAATDLSNVDLETFLESIGNIAKWVKRKWNKANNGKLAIIIGPWKEDGERVDLALLCRDRIQKYLDLSIRIVVPYSTEVHGGAFVKMAKEKRELLYLYRDLMVFSYPQE